jgi:HPt (histidine-containing phosphotransfer) domain-containing protein
MSEPAIDRAIYDDLKETVGEEFFKELVDTFLIDTTMLIGDLREALGKNDTDTVRRTAHSLKSNSATFGASRLSLQLEIEGFINGT